MLIEVPMVLKSWPIYALSSVKDLKMWCSWEATTNRGRLQLSSILGPSVSSGMMKKSTRTLLSFLTQCLSLPVLMVCSWPCTEAYQVAWLIWPRSMRFQGFRNLAKTQYSLISYGMIHCRRAKQLRLTMQLTRAEMARDVSSLGVSLYRHSFRQCS